ncbi:hypothetical protein HAX54_037119 [Datura stramonium]|uniref:Uncharacterized protein n=1 Tax=Datura stramonium TaxID=4076 RepID=A0ABS8VIN1_DATST|nr:hypothetical protein [Datura stramonium]
MHSAFCAFSEPLETLPATTMAAPHTAQDPIDDPLGNLEEDDEADENEDGGDGENASGEIGADDDVEDYLSLLDNIGDNVSFT